MFLVTVVLVVFGNTLLNGFVWDDKIFTVGNQVYREFDLHKIFFGLANGVEYLPIRDVTYALDYALWGELATGYHITNLILYIINVLLVYYMVLKITTVCRLVENDKSAAVIAFITSLLFAIHPLNSEAVSFITCRNVQVSAVFFFAGIILYAKFLEKPVGNTVSCYVGALICFACALLSKSTTIIFPIILLLLALFVPHINYRRKIVATLPFFLLACAFFFIYRAIGLQSGIIEEQMQVATASGLQAKAAVALQIPFFYLAKLLVPIGLSAEYLAGFSRKIYSVQSLLSLAGLIVIAAGTRYARTWSPGVSFGIGWFFVTLLPVLNFFATNPEVADRYVFLPSLGFCLVCATVIERLDTFRPGWISTAVVLLLVFVWGAGTVARNAVWSSDRRLWEDVLQKSPKLVKAYVNLADEAVRGGDFNRALSLLEKTRSLGPVNDYYEYYQALYLFSRGDKEGAFKAAQRSLLKNDEYVAALYFLGHLTEKEGRYEEAIDYYNRAITSRYMDYPQQAKARGRLQSLQQHFANDLAALRRKVAEHPADFDARINLALKLDKLVLYDEALQEYKRLEQAGVRKWQLYYNVGNIYQKQKRWQDSAAAYEQCIALKPDNVDALNNLGSVRTQLKEYPAAINAFSKAIALDSSFAYAHFNLAMTYYESGDMKSAVRHFRLIKDNFPVLIPRVEPLLAHAQETLK